MSRKGGPAAEAEPDRIEEREDMLWAVQADERRICWLGLEGGLTGDDLANLAGRLRGLAAQGVSRVVVDLRKVDHWDFRGLRALAEAVEHRRARGGTTAFITRSRYLRDIAAAAGVLDRLEFYDDVRWEDGANARPEEALDVPLRRVSGDGP